MSDLIEEYNNKYLRNKKVKAKVSFYLTYMRSVYTNQPEIENTEIIPEYVIEEIANRLEAQKIDKKLIKYLNALEKKRLSRIIEFVLKKESILN